MIRINVKKILVLLVFCLTIGSAGLVQAADINGIWVVTSYYMKYLVLIKGPGTQVVGLILERNLQSGKVAVGTGTATSFNLTSLKKDVTISGELKDSKIKGTLVENGGAPFSYTSSLVFKCVGGPQDGIWSTTLNKFIIYGTAVNGDINQAMALLMTLDPVTLDITCEYFMGACANKVFTGYSVLFSAGSLVLSGFSIQLEFKDCTDQCPVAGKYLTMTSPPSSKAFSATQIIKVVYTSDANPADAQTGLFNSVFSPFRKK
ncbi:MAG: hypothetical protein HQK56_20420 [Deltaproteobacteria bacterium]|nr:hypothetical protein [Deltaproteobacteria bacterium]